MSKRKAPRPNVKALKGASSEHAYRALMHEIVSFTLVPGEDLDEATLVGRLGVSRTPVREALVRLAAEGLVQLVPNRGARVAPMGWNDIREHLEAFDVSQRLVTRWAAIRRNELYVFTHTEGTWRSEVEQRFNAILAAMDRAAAEAPL